MSPVGRLGLRVRVPGHAGHRFRRMRLSATPAPWLAAGRSVCVPQPADVVRFFQVRKIIDAAVNRRGAARSRARWHGEQLLFGLRLGGVVDDESEIFIEIHAQVVCNESRIGVTGGGRKNQGRCWFDRARVSKRRARVAWGSISSNRFSGVSSVDLPIHAVPGVAQPNTLRLPRLSPAFGAIPSLKPDRRLV